MRYKCPKTSAKGWVNYQYVMLLRFRLFQKQRVKEPKK